MFKLAKSLSPDTLFFLNDYGIIMDRLFYTTLIICIASSEMVDLGCSNSK